MKDKITLTTPGNFDLEPVARMPDEGLGDLQSLIRWGTTALMITAVILTLFFLILGGIQWITSRGNKDALQAAQRKIIYASIGLVVTLAAFFIVNFVGNFFGIEFF